MASKWKNEEEEEEGMERKGGRARMADKEASERKTEARGRQKGRGWKDV